MGKWEKKKERKKRKKERERERERGGVHLYVCLQQKIVESCKGDTRRQLKAVRMILNLMLNHVNIDE